MHFQARLHIICQKAAKLHTCKRMQPVSVMNCCCSHLKTRMKVLTVPETISVSRTETRAAC